MKKTVLSFGIISGLIVTVIMVISMVYYYNNPGRVSNTSAMIIGYLSMLVAFALIYVGIKRYRDNENAGTISFGKAFRIGLLIAFIASTMYVAAWALLCNLYMPDYMERYTEQMIKQSPPGTTAKKLAETKAEMEHYKQLYRSPLYFTLMTYAEILPVGMLVSIICAFILKRRRKPANVTLPLTA